MVLSHAFDRPAIAIDVHVATVAKRLGLVEKDARSGEVKVAMVPPEERRLVDCAFVRLGKKYCRTRARDAWIAYSRSFVITQSHEITNRRQDNI